MDILLAIVAIFISLSVHEASHGLVAYSLGDPTAKMEGRLTLNPIAHIDMLGTLILPLLLVLAHMPVFGWAKPVPVNHRNFKNPVRDSALTALAGPLSNFVMALLAALILTYTHTFIPDLLERFLWFFFNVNVALGIFNFLPLAPLDGSKIIGLIIPSKYHVGFLRFLSNSTIYFVLIILFDIYVMPSILGYSFFGRLVGNLLDTVKFFIFGST